MIKHIRTVDNSPDRLSGRSGLTLMELMVVLAIVAVGWFALLPNLDLGSSDIQASSEMEALNRMLVEARLKCLHEGEIQVLTVTNGNDLVEWGDESVVLPSYLAYCLVNGERPPGRQAAFRIYPSGFMDEVELVLSMGDTWSSDILSVSFAEKEE